VIRVALLDVNVLLALFDPDHVHHEPAHDWFADQRAHGWATCAMTENGLIRVLSNPAYGPNTEPPAAIIARLRTFCGSGHHTFWPDVVSCRDEQVFHPRLPVTSRQLTDVYLLALARHHGGCLATFDQAIPSKAVIGATQQDLLVIRG
jgi:uncharacterized protein